MRGLVAACALLVAFAAAAGAEEARPQRIVSINMCTDELLRLADKARIASVTWLSQDPRNANMAEAAKAFPANHGMAEEVLSYNPDLVLAGAFTTRATVDALKRTGVKVVEFGAPETLEGVRKEIRALAAAIGEPARREALVSRRPRPFLPESSPALISIRATRSRTHSDAPNRLTPPSMNVSNR